MKNKLQLILRSIVPSPLFAFTCVLLLVAGAVCWAATEKIGRDADARMETLTRPTTPQIGKMLQARR